MRSLRYLLPCLAVLHGALASSPTSWIKRGIGAVKCGVTAEDGHASFVASESGAIGRLRLEDGSADWITPPSHKSDSLTALTHATDEGLLLATINAVFGSGDDAVTQTSLRALDSSTGVVRWTHPVCSTAVATYHAGCVVKVTGCGDADEFIDVASGKESDSGASCASAEGTTGEAACEGDSWSSSAGVLSRGKIGRLSFFAGEDATEPVWVREEGVSEPAAAAFFRGTGASRRVLVVVSELGGVFGLDIENGGSILWSVDIESMVPGEGKATLQLVKGSAEYAFVVAVAADTDASSVVVVSSVDGDVVSETYFSDYRPVQAALVGSPALCVSLIDEAAVERVAGPDCEFARVAPKSWVLASKGSDSIRGFEEGSVVWETTVPFAGRVMGVAGLSPADPFSLPAQAASVRVTASRQLLFKYMNPGVVLVVSEVASTSENVANNVTGIVAMLIDARTGAVFDVVRHSGAVGPVKMLRSENWFVYTFWNAEEMEHEVHVIDMYETGKRPEWMKQALWSYLSAVLIDFVPDMLVPHTSSFIDRLGALLGVNPADNGESQCQAGDRDLDALSCRARESSSRAGKIAQDGFDGSLPRLAKTSYLTTHPITALGVTVTERGATDRSVLMGLSSGQVTLIPRMVLDPRRPKDHSHSAASEMLFKYTPLLSLWPSKYGRYYMHDGEAVSGLHPSGLVTSPMDGRESTCHYAAVGRDIMYGLSAPAGEFDTLSEDFSYSIVVFSLSVLAFGIHLTNRAHKKKTLDEFWVR